MYEIGFVDICVSIGFILIGIVLRKIAKKTWPTLPINVVTSFVLFHTALALAYFKMSTTIMLADATVYFEKATNSPNDWSAILDLGNGAINIIIYPLIHWFGFGYLSCFLVFNAMGIIGALLLYAETRSYLTSLKAKKLYNYLLFIPGMSFWTCALGKDSMVILGLGLALSSFHKLKQRWLRMLLGMIITVYVRPHIFIVIVITAAIWFLLNPNKSVKQVVIKTVLFLVFSAIFLSTYSLILDYAGFRADLSVGNLQTYLEFRQTINEGTSTVDITQYSVLGKYLTYLFRPLFFDAKNMLMILASFENLILVYLLIQVFRPKHIKVLFLKKNLYTRFHIIYFFLGLTMLALTTGNLGIAVRQKTMILPSFLVVTVKIISDGYEMRKKRATPKDIPLLES